MWRRRGLRWASSVTVVLVGVLAGSGCGQGGTGAGADPVEIVPTAPRAPLVPDALPEGFSVEGVSAGGAADMGGDSALLIGAPERRTGPGSGPVIVVGESSGSASIAGPGSAGGETVSDLGAPDSFDPYIAEDGPWTWVVFNDDRGCIEDCLDYVAGKGVPDEDLIAVARGTTYDDAGPVVEPSALPDGLAPLLTASPADGVLTASAVRINLRSADGLGMITVQQVDAAAELALLWGFWIDDAAGTPIRGERAWAGPLGATNEGGDYGRVWVEGGRVIAVMAWDVSAAVLDQVIDGLRPGTPDDLAALGDELVARLPMPEDAMCGSAVLSARSSTPAGSSAWGRAPAAIPTPSRSAPT